MAITQVAVDGFRCFGSAQEARIARLTLLVGENSVGKTSFLAMVRALRDSAAAVPRPDFNAPPYAFGSYDDMAYRKGSMEEGAVAEFGGSLTISPERGSARDATIFSARYSKKGKEPTLLRRRFESGGYWLEHEIGRPGAVGYITVGTPSATVKAAGPQAQLPHVFEPWMLLHFFRISLENDAEFETLSGSASAMKKTWNRTQNRLYGEFTQFSEGAWPEVFPGAPIRSEPKRTYEATPGRAVAEGDRVPRRLADLRADGGAEWDKLAHGLRRYGRDSGMFEDIDVRHLGRHDSDPIQISVEPSGSPQRNLTDVGYGVSQALPILVEVLNGDPNRVFLLQQPEVHLHPRAQATLGSLLVRAAAQGRHLLVETHSDHLIDRVRMDIRDSRPKTMKPEDISVLYFERAGSDVGIHSLRLDAQGNILGAPRTYRRFFMQEVARSFGS